MDKKSKKSTKTNWEQEAKQNLENWQRAQAELENTKKRLAKDKEEFIKFATKELVLDLLPIIDNFDRAIEHVPADNQNSDWLTGITYIHKQLLDMLTSYQVNKVEAKVGDQFDQGQHNAIERMESDQPENTIIKVINQAYTMNGEVIRPAAVIVSAGKK